LEVHHLGDAFTKTTRATDILLIGKVTGAIVMFDMEVRASAIEGDPRATWMEADSSWIDPIDGDSRSRSRYR